MTDGYALRVDTQFGRYLVGDYIADPQSVDAVSRQEFCTRVPALVVPSEGGAVEAVHAEAAAPAEPAGHPAELHEHADEHSAAPASDQE